MSKAGSKGDGNELEVILRNNLVQAYLDYVEEFGLEMAREVCNEIC